MTFPRLSIPGNACTQCGAVIGQSLTCPGCGWVDPPTRAIALTPRKALMRYGWHDIGCRAGDPDQAVPHFSLLDGEMARCTCGLTAVIEHLSREGGVG